MAFSRTKISGTGLLEYYGKRREDLFLSKRRHRYVSLESIGRIRVKIHRDSFLPPSRELQEEQTVLLWD